MTSAVMEQRGRKGQGRRGLGRERLVTEAVKLFGERGFNAVSTKELALAAGLTIGAIYHHFPSKEAIYRAALEEALAACPPAPLDEAAGLSPRAGVTLQVAWFAETLIREPLLRQELLDPHLDVSLTELPFFAPSLAMFRRRMPEGAPTVDPDMAISAIVSLSFGFTSLRGIGSNFAPPDDPRALGELVTRLVLGGDNVPPA